MAANYRGKKAGVKTPALSSLPDFSLERELYRKGYRILAGVDEAGRGSLAGPLAVGIVIYDLERTGELFDILQGRVADSKKLSGSKRAAAAELVTASSRACRVSLVSPAIVDRLNVNGATEFAIQKGIAALPVVPDAVLMDGNFSFHLGIPFFSYIKGDQRSLSIASASIIAKVERDRLMKKFELLYPGYGFAGHKGYGTAFHREMITRKGPSPIHRKSYEPLKSILEKDREDRP